MMPIKRGPGRPRKTPIQPPAAVDPSPPAPLTRDPEAIIRALEAQVNLLKREVQDGKDPLNELKALAEIIRIIQRAVKGQGADDDIFQGLIDVRDIRERTRLDEAAVLSHSAMLTATQAWPELGLFGKIADMEEHTFISEDGEGRKEGILLQQAKTGVDRSNLILNMPNTQGGPVQDPNTQAQTPKKKSLIDRVLKR